MRRISWFGIPVLAVPLLFVTELVCSCEPDPHSIAGQMQIFSVEDGPLLPPEKNEELGRKYFIGRNINQLPTSGLATDAQCQFISKIEMQCVFWNKESILFQSGRAVVLAANQEGVVNSVSVKYISHWGWRESQTSQETPSK